LQREHQPGPAICLFFITSHVGMILTIKHHIKIFYLIGILNFHSPFHHHSRALRCRSILSCV
jgi:hypothetical protein